MSVGRSGRSGCSRPPSAAAISGTSRRPTPPPGGRGPEAMRSARSASGPLPPGGGVGLRLVHDIVEGLGGRLHHERTDGQTLIRVDLPSRGASHA